jgi:predicted DNA-binding protein YlxM (UPF0122 family)
LSDEQCRYLADWYRRLRSFGTVEAKAKELGISKPALYDAIARGQGRMTAATRFKLSEAEIDELTDLVIKENS